MFNSVSSLYHDINLCGECLLYPQKAVNKYFEHQISGVKEDWKKNLFKIASIAISLLTSPLTAIGLCVKYFDKKNVEIRDNTNNTIIHRLNTMSDHLKAVEASFPNRFSLDPADTNFKEVVFNAPIGGGSIAQNVRGWEITYRLRDHGSDLRPRESTGITNFCNTIENMIKGVNRSLDRFPLHREPQVKSDGTGCLFPIANAQGEMIGVQNYNTLQVTEGGFEFPRNPLRITKSYQCNPDGSSVYSAEPSN